jgi:hypothetical protein
MSGSLRHPVPCDGQPPRDVILKGMDAVSKKPV